MACQHCEAEGLFEIKNLPGVPVGRTITPVVRINGQVQDLPIGMKIPCSMVCHQPIPTDNLTPGGFVAWLEGLEGEDATAVEGALKTFLGIGA